MPVPTKPRTTLDPARPRTRRIRSGNIGFESRDSTATNTASSATAAAPNASVCADSQP